jgi:hypothetical protein
VSAHPYSHNCSRLSIFYSIVTVVLGPYKSVLARLSDGIALLALLLPHLLQVKKQLEDMQKQPVAAAAAAGEGAAAPVAAAAPTRRRSRRTSASKAAIKEGSA